MIRAGIIGSISVALLVLIFCQVGCQGPPVPKGSFIGQHRLQIVPGTDPVVANQLLKVQLTIDEKGWANFEDGGVPREGQMSRDGSNLKFEVWTVFGRNIQQQGPDQARFLTFTLEKDGTIRYGDAILKPAS